MLNLMTTYSIVAQPKTADVFNHYVRYCACDAAAASARALVVLRACSLCFPNQATTRAPIKQRADPPPRLFSCVCCGTHCVSNLVKLLPCASGSSLLGMYARAVDGAAVGAQQFEARHMDENVQRRRSFKRPFTRACTIDAALPSLHFGCREVSSDDTV